MKIRLWVFFIGAGLFSAGPAWADLLHVWFKGAAGGSVGAAISGIDEVKELSHPKETKGIATSGEVGIGFSIFEFKYVRTDHINSDSYAGSTNAVYGGVGGEILRKGALGVHLGGGVGYLWGTRKRADIKDRSFALRFDPQLRFYLVGENLAVFASTPIEAWLRNKYVGTLPAGIPDATYHWRAAAILGLHAQFSL